MLPNRLKFAVGGPLLELANPHLAGHPHQRVADLNGPDDHRVLEVCAGTGYLARLVAAQRPYCRLDALDLSQESLALGRHQAAGRGLDRIRFLHGNAAEMPFDDDTFDTAISCYGFHEIPTAGRLATFAELARVIRPGGKVIAADWDTPQRGRRSVEFVIRMAEKPYALEVVGDGLADALTAVGFTVTRHDRASSRVRPFQVVEARLG